MLSYTVEPRRMAARVDYWNQAMREVFRSTWNVNPVRPADFHMSMKAVPIGGMVLSQASLSQATISNRPEQADHGAEHPYYIYIVNRRQHVTTAGREFDLLPGDFTLADSAQHSAMVTEQPYTTIALTVPASLLRRHLPAPEEAVGIRFSGRDGLARTISIMLVSMWKLAERDGLREVGVKLATNLLEIFSTCCHLQGCCRPLPAPGSSARRGRIKSLIGDALRDPELTVENLARELGVSPRYLQILFAEENDTVSSYIRRQRLEGCRRQLADPIWRERSITEIAFSWGFNNAAHFARVFRAEFGMSARDFRKRVLAGQQALESGDPN